MIIERISDSKRLARIILKYFENDIILAYSGSAADTHGRTQTILSAESADNIFQALQADKPSFH